MINFISKYKKISIILSVIVVLLLVLVYLYALFLPGVWHNGTFLYKKDNESFSGSDQYADYIMTTAKNGAETDISFKVNETAKEYKVIKDESTQGVKIFENGEEVFSGTVLPMENINILKDENGKLKDIVRISVGGVKPEESELFPTLTELYNFASGDTDTRGNPYMLILIAFLAAVLALDIAFPNLFFYLKHGINVDGGTPSEYYRAGQTFGRVAGVIGIIACVVSSFTMH